MDLIDIPATETFLTLLGRCDGSVVPAGGSTLAVQLLQALRQDGYTLQHTGIVSRSLRGLSESSGGGGGGVDVVALIMVGVCIMCAGFASGLTQGLLSLDSMEMEIKARSGTEEEKRYAAKLIPIISHHHLLLVTLMLWNASATEALPIFLSALVPEYLAIIISVTLVLFVGEIIPASILTGPKQLQITASLTPMVYCVLAIFFPIAYPIAKGLDVVIGHSDMTMYNRTEISTMMRLHREVGVKRATEAGGHGHEHGGAGNDSLYAEEEVDIIAGALKYRDMAVSEAMTPALQAYMICAADTLNYKLIYEIFKSGYSRIPVFEKDRNDVVGLILAKDLIFIDPEDATPVRSFLDLFGRKPAVVWHDSKLGETLSMFKAERSHMAIVRDVECEGEGDPFYKIVGIITLEDIVEEILGTEIEDETDAVEYDVATMVRDPELARLRTIHTAPLQQQSLTDEEVHSISIYLFTNVPQMQRMFRENTAGLQKLVRASTAITLTRKAPQGERPSQEDFLYRRGKMSTTCTLVLSGTVEVHEDDGTGAGAGTGAGTGAAPEGGGKVVTKGPWSILAVGALEAAEGSYIPGFTACVASETVRFLRLSTNEGQSTSLHPLHHHGRSKSFHASMMSTGTTTSTTKAHRTSSSTMQPLAPAQHTTDWADTISYSIAPLRQRTHHGHIPGDQSDLESAEAAETASTRKAAIQMQPLSNTSTEAASSAGRVRFPEEERKAEVEGHAVTSPASKPTHTNGYAPVNRHDSI